MILYMLLILYVNQFYTIGEKSDSDMMQIIKAPGSTSFRHREAVFTSTGSSCSDAACSLCSVLKPPCRLIARNKQERAAAASCPLTKCLHAPAAVSVKGRLKGKNVKLRKAS